MDDRELLEMAAKAAGIGLSGFSDSDFGLMVERSDGGWWDPLDDDGDAFRLAAYLRLEVIPGKHAGDGCSVNSRRHEIPGITVFRDSKDMAEQMRRAILMAAAEIGKSMP